MGFFSWLERRIYLGEVIRDYGEISRKSGFLYRMTTTLKLCRSREGLKLVWTTKAFAPFGFSVRYQDVPLDEASLALLRQIVRDLEHALPAGGAELTRR